MSLSLRGYLLGTGAVAAVIEVALWVVSAPHGLARAPLALLLIAAGGLAANFPVEISRRYKADLSPAIYFACVLLYDPVAAVAVVAVSRIIGEAAMCVRRNTAGVRRRDLWSLVFNVGQIAIASAAAALAYHYVLSAAGVSAREAVAPFVAAALMYGVSTLAVVIAIGIKLARNPLSIWAEVGRLDFFQNIALYFAGFVLAALSADRPWMVPVVMLPITAVQLSMKKSVQLAQQTIAAVEAMADVVDTRDPYTYRHSTNVAEHAVAIARRLRLKEADVDLIRLAARVHDLGKIGVPDAVLHKEGRLTAEEFDLMKRHPEVGAEILSRYPQYRRGRELVLAHHERVDGLGYPRGLRGDAIPLGARVIAVADSWDAMTSDRPYRRALDQSVAYAELERGRGRQWDPQIVDAFIELMTGRPPVSGRRMRTSRVPAIRALGAAVGILP